MEGSLFAWLCKPITFSESMRLKNVVFNLHLIDAAEVPQWTVTVITLLFVTRYRGIEA